MSVTLDALSADADLYVRHGAKPDLAEPGCRPFYGGTTAEECRYTDPETGRWWIGVNNWAVGTITYRLTASLQPRFRVRKRVRPSPPQSDASTISRTLRT